MVVGAHGLQLKTGGPVTTGRVNRADELQPGAEGKVAGRDGPGLDAHQQRHARLGKGGKH